MKREEEEEDAEEDLDLALASLPKLWPLDLREKAREPPLAWIVAATEGEAAEAAEAATLGGLMSVGKDRSVFGAIPMLTSAVPSDALNRTPVYKGKSSVVCQHQLFNLL